MMKREAFNHPKMLDLASRLGVTKTHACGIVASLLNWAGDMAPQGDIGKWANGSIAYACDWNGDSEAFVNALVESGWVDRCPLHRLIIHDIADHAPQWWTQKLTKMKLRFLTPVTTAEGTAEATQVEKVNTVEATQSEKVPSAVPSAVPSILLCSSPLCSSQLPSSHFCSEPSAKAHEHDHDDEPSGLIFSTRGKRQTYSLPKSKLAEYVELYQGMDVEHELKKARQWCLDNISKRKTAGGMPKFLANWLNRAADRGSSQNLTTCASRYVDPNSDEAAEWSPQ